MENKNNFKKIKNLSLCGGGFYGYAEVGALKELEKYNKYIDIQNIKGVSVGSIVAALYAVGYTPDEMTKILFNMNFDYLIRDSSFFSYFRLYDRFGLYDANKLEYEIEKLISIKTHIKLCTFYQIKINLTIISTNLNLQCPRFFNKYETPNLPISKAVRMSIGYPLIITPVLFEGDFYGDGGEFINYPITTFDNLDETIGITFSKHNENKNGTLKNKIIIKNLYDYVQSIGMTMSRATYISQITEKYLKRSIIIHIENNINSMQFNLTKEEKLSLYNFGIKAVKEQIKNILNIIDD